MQPGFLRYGWGMVALAGSMDFIATGLFFYSYGVFFPYIAEEFGTSRAGTSLGMTLFLMTVALASTQVGTLINRIGLRRMFALGSATMGIGLTMLSLAPSEIALVPSVLVTAAGAAALGQIGPARLVANWFVYRRGSAMGFATVGISLSGVVMPLVAAWLLSWLDWRSVLQIYALVCLFGISSLALWLTQETPSAVGLSPDGNPDLPPLGKPVKRLNRRYVMAFLRNPSIWLLTVLFACQFCCISAVLTHMVPMSLDYGLSTTEASQLLALTAVLAVVGKIVFGQAADRVGTSLLLLTAIGLQGAGIWLLFSNPDIPYNLILGALSFGLGFGAAVPLQNFLFARAFANSMTVAMGLTRPLMLPLQLMGPPMAGWIYDQTGSYSLASWYMLAFLALAAVSAVLIPRLMRHHPRGLVKAALKRHAGAIAKSQPPQISDKEGN